MSASETTEGIPIDLFVFSEGAETELIVFGEAARAQRRESLGRDSDITCQSCGSDLLYALGSRPVSDDTWEVTVRCPDCEWYATIVVGRYVMERFVAQLHMQKRALARDLARIDVARFRETVESELELIRDDLLLPADF